MILTRAQLKQFRRRIGKSKEEFAKAIGYSYSYISKIENGRLEFSSGVKKAVNDYAKRLEAYKKGCSKYETVQKKEIKPVEEKKPEEKPEEKVVKDSGLEKKLFWILFIALVWWLIWTTIN